MKHRALLSAGVLILTFFFSCSNQIEQSSSVTFSLPGNAVRAITAEADGNWSLKISLSGGCEMEKIFEIQEDSIKKDLSFSFDDLPVGETVTVDVNIYCGNVWYYKTAKNKTLTLENGENTVDIVLVRNVSDGTITAESFAEKVSISAKYSSDASIVYDNLFTSTSAIPYNNDTLTFSLSGLDDYNLDDDAFAWYLNGDTTLEGGDEISFIPYEQSGLNIDDSNAIVCYVAINGTTYATSMSFTFSAARSAAVWFDGVNATTVNQDKYYSLNQLGDDKNTEAKASELISNLSESPIYCFDKNFNLWTAVSGGGDTGLVLTKYSMILSSGLYNTTGTSITNENIKTTPIDMTYDATTEYFYFLEGNENNGYTLHKTLIEDITKSEYTDETWTFSITDSEGNTVTPSQIAICGDIIYVAGSDCNIYKGTGVGVGSNVTLTINFTETASLASSDLLTNYNAKTESTYLSITDLQIGDGLGTDTSSLYVLVREYSNGNGKLQMSADNNSIYSKGALVKIAISDTNTVTSYGWTTSIASVTDNYGTEGTLYAPNSSSTEVEFYGPTHFVAVLPKKLVILDDGISATGEQGKLNNMDSLVEFDIAESSLSRGASVSATTPTADVSFFSVL